MGSTLWSLGELCLKILKYVVFKVMSYFWFIKTYFVGFTLILVSSKKGSEKRRFGSSSTEGHRLHKGGKMETLSQNYEEDGLIRTSSGSCNYQIFKVFYCDCYYDNKVIQISCFLRSFPVVMRE